MCNIKISIQHCTGGPNHNNKKGKEKKSNNTIKELKLSYLQIKTKEFIIIFKK